MDTKYGEKFTIDVYPDSDSFNTFYFSGSRTKIREDEDGRFIKLSRNLKGPFAEASGPPQVVDENNQPFSKPIGNGSVVTCFVDVYPSKFGTGTRLRKVHVRKLVEYTPSSEPDLPPI